MIATLVLSALFTANVARSCPGISFLDILLDKKTSVAIDYVPLDLVKINNQWLRSEAANQLAAMRDDLQKHGLTFLVNSGFRPSQEQDLLYKTNVWAVLPGHSEHQLGTAVDLSLNKRAKNWFGQNAYKYGFVQSYRFEPWHWRFVGVALANKIRFFPLPPQSFYRKISCP